MNRIEPVAKYRRGELPAKGKPDTERNKKRNELTQKLAATPTRLHVQNMPSSEVLVIPEVSSETRFLKPDAAICSNLVKLMPNATLYHFGVLTSVMHMAWVRTVAGRLKSDYRYSVKLVYNNFPCPTVTDAQRGRVEDAARSASCSRTTPSAARHEHTRNAARSRACSRST
jgi:hypothetical protein